DLTTREAGRVPVLLAVELPRGAAIIAVRVDLVAIGEPQVQAAVLVTAGVGTRRPREGEQGAMLGPRDVRVDEHRLFVVSGGLRQGEVDRDRNDEFVVGDVAHQTPPAT